ncbi:MAG: NAD(P)-dependent glycerol-3-phosphate dehydrogenase [Phycisphaerales bacterium]|nr:NAD(P)-dependent glycerol-3-phosphate dehydrogenase [Phycisphaerales bacterium]
MTETGPAHRRMTVIGDGQMGLVMAEALACGDHQVRLWGPFPDHVEQLARTRLSDRLPGYRLGESIEVCTDARHALEGADLVVCAIPCQFVRSVFMKLKDQLDGSPVLVSVAKGVEIESLERPTEILDSIFDGSGCSTVCLSGPTIASELARHQIAIMVAAGADPAATEFVQDAFSTRWLRIYTSSDVLGVEFAGAIKNVVAIAAGILDGLGAGMNAKSALLARGLAEIVRLGSAMGARPETFFGVAGVGDLATTCFSPEGRNRSCGEAIGRGVPLERYLEESMCVVEGVATTRAIMTLVERFEVEVPILSAVNDVLFEGVSARDAIDSLLSREAGPEIVG